MEISEPADEEDLPTFSLGFEFLTPEKKKKKTEEKEKREKAYGPYHRVLQNY